ncbi:exosome complex component RRP46-like [Styela clava]
MKQKEMPGITVDMKVMRCEQNILNNPDGSADYSEGDTNVLVAVYGPADCRESKQLIDKSTIEVSFRPKDGIPGVAEKYLEHTIRHTFENVIMTHLYPRSQIMIIIQIVQDCGSLLSCAINGCSMALQDAGISMTCMPAAISMALTKRAMEYGISEPGEGDTREEEVVLTPATTEEQEASASMLFVLDSVKRNVISIISKGTIDPVLHKRCLIAARTASEIVFKFYRDSVAKKVSSSVDFT